MIEVKMRQLTTNCSGNFSAGTTPKDVLIRCTFCEGKLWKKFICSGIWKMWLS